MPILDVEIVLHPREKVRPTLAKELADRAGEILGSAPGGTWVKVHPIPAERYAEGPGDGLELTPVFVTILKATLQSPELRQAEIERLTGAVAAACGRPK